MAFDYFYGRSAEQFAFYQIPKLLITDDRFAGISTDAKLLYSMMLDRASLSARNGWLDSSGRVYIFYTLDQIMADMHCANQKATKMMKELEEKAGLIERKKQGQGKPARIYVKDFSTGLGHDLMSVDQLAVMDGSKCIVQVRGVRPFLSNKYDLTQHPNYCLTSDYDKKNWLDVEKYLKQRRRGMILHPDDRFEVVGAVE